MAEPYGSVLIVEDDHDIRASLCDILEVEGYKVFQATNGQEAMDALTAAGELPRAILLDLMMPIVDGYTFRLAQQREPRLAKIPVVVMSAAAQIELERLNLAPQNVLSKPLDLEHLMDTLERCCALPA